MFLCEVNCVFIVFLVLGIIWINFVGIVDVLNNLVNWRVSNVVFLLGLIIIE